MYPFKFQIVVVISETSLYNNVLRFRCLPQLSSFLSQLVHNVYIGAIAKFVYLQRKKYLCTTHLTLKQRLIFISVGKYLLLRLDLNKQSNYICNTLLEIVKLVLCTLAVTIFPKQFFFEQQYIAITVYLIICMCLLSGTVTWSF